MLLYWSALPTGHIVREMGSLVARPGFSPAHKNGPAAGWPWEGGFSLTIDVEAAVRGPGVAA